MTTNSTTTTEKQRLSRTVSNAEPHYDAIVVGSGYGAGVAVNRLAKAGKRTALIERGPERVPGEFPDSLLDAAREFQITRGGTHLGNRSGLFDMRVQSDVSVLLGCGLGGTSLINGNVMLKPEAAVLQAADWPSCLREDTGSLLSEAYERALTMLESVPYPNDVPLQKLKAFEQQAHGVGGELSLPPINVTFATRETTVGAIQPKCTLCGDCCSGCNVGAKNTTAMNYLADAKAAGAELFTGAEVQWVEKVSDGWKLHYKTADDKSADALHTLTCSDLFLGAGTLGSTEILLRSQQAGLGLSPQLGKGFSGNGDVIAFGYNNDMPVNGIGIGHPPREESDPVGPVIAGLIDLRNTGRLDKNIVIQEGALPKSLATGAYKGAVANTQTFLVMAHEASQGEMRLVDDELTIHWPDAGRDPVFEHISETLERATAATGGTYIANPIWAESLGRNLVSVHPLGGCVMADSAEQGVVDDCGRVYADTGAIHSGLHVLDGSVVPSSLGVNPSLTITALAERAMALLLK